MGSFIGLEIAKTGLFVSRKGLEVTGHNISNADTEGYTRQRLVTASVDPYAYEGRFLQIGNVGGGVDTIMLDQIRNEYVDREYRRENSDLGYWETKTNELEYVETLINEGTEIGLSNALADFFDSINELSKDTVSEDIRTNVQQTAVQLTETLNHYYEKSVELQKVYNDSVDVVVTTVNDNLKNIAAYNKQIYAFELSGENANDLRDKRNVLLDELSHNINIEYYENSEGNLVVTSEGHELINHTTATLLETRAELTGAVSGEPDFYEIYLEGTSTTYSSSEGSLRAYIDLRDGNTADNLGIPKILDELNILTRSIAKEFNDVNNAGYTIPYGSVSSQMGVDLFNVPSGDYNLLNAGNFRISDEFEESAFNIATSDSLVDLTADNTQQGNNINALKMVDLTTKNDISVVSNFDTYLQSLVVNIALESSQAINRYEGQDAVVSNLENRRMSISGVSVDEEMVELVKYQHAYSAASRMITAVDEAMEVLINKTGLVGR